jgi:hypothetical protein
MGLMTPTRKNLLLQNHGGDQEPHKVVVPAKRRIRRWKGEEEKDKKNNFFA